MKYHDCRMTVFLFSSMRFMAISISGGHGMESGRAVRDEADFLQRWPMQDVKERINDITCPVCWLVRQTGWVPFGVIIGRGKWVGCSVGLPSAVLAREKQHLSENALYGL